MPMYRWTYVTKKWFNFEYFPRNSVSNTWLDVYGYMIKCTYSHVLSMGINKMWIRLITEVVVYTSTCKLKKNLCEILLMNEACLEYGV